MMKESEHSTVYVVKSQRDGKRYVLLQFHGTAEIYKKLMTITSPHLPKIYAVEEQDGIVTVLEEYIQGDTLAFLLEGTGLDRGETKDLMLQLCDALELLHKNGIVHRDIKPENVIVRGKTAVLIDFNASRKYKSAQTEDTVVLGTTGFAAPEQYGISQSDNRVDVYALGVLLNIMLTGQHPSAKLAEGPGGKIVQRCTMVSPNQRFQSVEQLKKRLRLLHGGRYSTVRIACVALLIAVIAGAAGAGAYTALRGSSDSGEESHLETQAALENGTQPVSAMDTETAVSASVLEAASEAEPMPSIDEAVGFYGAFPETVDGKITDFHFDVTDTERTLWFVYPEQLDGQKLLRAVCNTEGIVDGPAPTDENVANSCVIGEPKASGITGFLCSEITMTDDFTGVGNLFMEAYYGEEEDPNPLGANIEVQAVASKDDAALQNAPTAEQLIGFYPSFPENMDQRISDFEFIMTESQNTLWFAYPESYHDVAVTDVQCYTGEPERPVAPTDQSVLDHCTIGTPERSGIDGLLCVAITFDADYSGQGNLHMIAFYGSDQDLGANVSVIAAEDLENAGDGQSYTAVDYMGYYTSVPQSIDEKIDNFEYNVPKDGGTLWFAFPETWGGDLPDDIYFYMGEPDGPAPTDQNVLEHCTLGEVEETAISGVSCIPVYIDDGFSGNGNLHIEVRYDDSRAGGNIALFAQIG